MSKNCPDYLTDLNDFLDGDLDSTLCAEFEEHIGQCDNCRIMVDTLRQTVALCRDGKPEPLPPELESKLTDILKARWNKKFGKRPD